MEFLRNLANQAGDLVLDAGRAELDRITGGAQDSLRATVAPGEVVAPTVNRTQPPAAMPDQDALPKGGRSGLAAWIATPIGLAAAAGVAYLVWRYALRKG